MKTFFFVLFLGCSALFAQEFNSEQKAIADIIQTAYVEGLQNEGDSAKIDQGFHPDFKLLGKGNENALRQYAIEPWRSRQIKAKANGKLPRKEENKVSITFEFIDITADVAVAKLNYLEGGIQTYVDYITLYKYDGGWKMISKAFHKI